MLYRAIALAVICQLSFPLTSNASFIDPDLTYNKVSTKHKSKARSAKHRKRYHRRTGATQAAGNSALNCLASNIYFEAGIEDRKGKIAVANVTMNRVKSKHYPGSVCDVVYQRGRSACAFSWTCDRKSNTPPHNELYRESEQIARLALSGALKDITGESDHYHATYVRPKWRDADKRRAKIGQHVFYKLLDG
jgi:spore germination cell wall hydrolase CwlJ-like protein